MWQVKAQSNKENATVFTAASIITLIKEVEEARVN